MKSPFDYYRVRIGSPAPCRAFAAALICISIMACLSLLAEEMVTIPKSRLQELEQKEAELQRLKGDYTKTKTENEQLQKKYDEAAAKAAVPAAASPAATERVSPPIQSLPPLEAGQTVDAMDLVSYYKADAKAADERFRKKNFSVRGEIVGFSKPPFIRPYKILLKSPDLSVKVVCEVTPPDKYKAVFTVKNGSELVGTIGETRVPLLKVGDTVVLEGECRGARDGTVAMTNCKFGTQP